ncbi:hypothetical protein S40288_01449 [Stachybotrys chartarum IBT 40288]|nr:hypothetical protein S40288_01449 [Stachybotrys chartarum IBT 40288]
MDDSDGNINRLMRKVVDASKLPPRSRSSDIKPTVAELSSLAYDQGLLPDTLSGLIDLVTSPSHLDQASLAAIVRNLYPATVVTRQAVIRVLSSLGHGELKPSLNIQAALLRWLVMVLQLIETPAVLSQAYSVLFNLLDTAATRSQLCHLLALITRRKHVKPFRIQALMDLSRKTGNDPSIVGLLRVFKDYYPDIIVGEAHPDTQWQARLEDIQLDNHHRSQNQIEKPRDGFRTHKMPKLSQARRVIPIVRTSHATERSVTLEEIENAVVFVGKLEKIELPNQLVAVLADPLLQKLLMLRPSTESRQRIVNWLHTILQDVIDGSTDRETLWDVLLILRDFVTQTHEFPPLLLNFFAQFLPSWDGSGPREALLQTLAHAPFHEFKELYQHVFGPLETAVLDDAADSQLAILAMYTNLLHHWTALLRADTAIPHHASASVAALVRHVNTLCLALLQTEPTLQTESAILDFYEQNCRLITDDTLIREMRIELPPALLLYSFLFSKSLATLSRMCYVLACYKKGFEMAMLTRSRRESSQGFDTLSYDKAYVTLYNGFLMDICNCFWRTRAFSDSDPETQGCMVPRVTTSALTMYVPAVEKTFTLASLFSLSHSPLLCLQSIQSVRQLEEVELERDDSIHVRHAGPVTQSSLVKLASSGGIRLSWQDYRTGVLEHLSSQGHVGINELLTNTMKVLRYSQGSRRSSQGFSSQ